MQSFQKPDLKLPLSVIIHIMLS